jgi:protein-tyrosine kinase
MNEMSSIRDRGSLIDLPFDDQLQGLQDEHVANQFVQLGKLTPKDVARVASWRLLHRDMSFSEAAVAMGLLSREDVMSFLSRQYSYPILEADPNKTRFSRELVVGHEPFSPAAEALRSIRSTIASSAIAQGTRSFLVTGPRPGAGTTFFAGNIALAFAQMSMPTLLVDANLRTPRVAQMFGLDRNKYGLAEYLCRRDVNKAPIVSDIIPNLSVLAAGAIPPNPQELLCTGEFLALTDNLAKEFGVVIYDTAAAMDFADAHVVASRVGAAVIVARRHRTTFDDISTVAKKLRTIECKVIGSVFNSN